MKNLLLLSAVATCAAAQAAVIFQEGNFTGGDNVLSGPIEGPAIVVKGEINSGGPVVVFTNNDGYLMTYTGGQATLEADDDDEPLRDFTVTMDDSGLWIDGIGLTIDVDDDGEVEFTTVTNEGTFSSTFDVDGNGNNRFRITTSGATEIYSLRVDTDVDMDAVKQVRINAVPEPGTMAALAVGALGVLRRRARK